MAVSTPFPASLVFDPSGGICAETSRRLAAGGWVLFLAGRAGDKHAALAAEVGASISTCDGRDAVVVNGSLRKRRRRPASLRVG